MTSGKDTMGEQPIFTCKAHVFHIDPKTKRSWMPASSTAFIDKFNEVKEATRNAISKVTSNGANVVTPVSSANASPITARAAAGTESADNLLEPPGSAALPQSQNKDDEIPHPRSHSISAMQVNESPSHQIKQEKPVTDIQLKYDNDRLKLALAQSSANAKKWEIELATLKSNNARLTSALQESTANVDEWKRQLASLKEENLRMRAKYQADLENSQGGGDIADELRKEIHSLRIRVEQLENELDSKNNEIKQQVASYKSNEYQILQKEHQELLVTAKLAQSELDAHESQRQVLLTLNEQLASRIQELDTIHDEISTALQT